MRINGKTRIGITLSMGVLVGLGLVILPGLFATPTTNPTSTGANVRTPTPTYTVGSSSSNPSNPSALTPTTDSVGTLAFAIALILLPAISMSIFVRYWTLKAQEKRWNQKSQ